MSRIDYPVILIFLVRLCSYNMQNGVGAFTSRDTNIVILGSSDGHIDGEAREERYKGSQKEALILSD